MDLKSPGLGKFKLDVNQCYMIGRQFMKDERPFVEGKKQGGGRMRIPNQGGESGQRPKKKKVTLPIWMVEVVIDMPKGTSDGSPGVQDVFELL